MKRLVLEVVTVLAAFGIGMAAHQNPVVLRVPEPECRYCNAEALVAVITTSPCQKFESPKPFDSDFTEARR
jgi:hypothetical protein